MKKLVITIMFIIVGFVGNVSGSNELLSNDVTDNIDVEAGIGWVSKYIWRGQLFTDDFVAQPFINISHKNFTLSLWGNTELTNVNNSKRDTTEIDITVDYSNYFPDLPVVGYSVGFIYYAFPNTNFNSTTELYAGLNLKTILSPYIKIYRDIDEVDGTYTSVGVSESLINEINVNASLGWGDKNYNHFYWGKNSGKFNDLVISISRSIEIKNNISIIPSLSYIRLIDKSLGSIGGNKDEFVIGLNFMKRF